jgi:hypothetical protein
MSQLDDPLVGQLFQPHFPVRYSQQGALTRKGAALLVDLSGFARTVLSCSPAARQPRKESAISLTSINR